MPSVLIIGATGYIGKGLAGVLVRSGQHRVYGIARDQEKAKLLAAEEVIPVVCRDPVQDPAPYLTAIREYNIDVVVDASSAAKGSSMILQAIKSVGQERQAAYAVNSVRRFPKLGYIYCSGTWVHGSSDKAINDLIIAHKAAAVPPVGLVAWRAELEADILQSSDVLDVAIVRPTLIYGRESAIWTAFFLPLLHSARSGCTDEVQIPLRPDARPGLIHLDDVVTGFQKVIEKLPLLNDASVYPVFDLVTSQESMSAVFEAVTRAWNLKANYRLVGSGDNLFADAMSATFRGSSARARQLLGWEPTRLNGFVNDMDIHAAAFASQHE